MIQADKPLPIGEHEIEAWRASYYEYNDHHISVYKYKDAKLCPYAIAIDDHWQKGEFFSHGDALDRAVELSK